MVIGGLMISEAVHLVGNTVIADIYKNKEILSPDGFRNYGFSFAGAETVAGRIHNKIVGYVAFKGRIVLAIF